MPHLYNTALLIGAALSAIAALLHIWVIATGPRGYRLCGAGDRFIKAAEAGKSSRPSSPPVSRWCCLFGRCMRYPARA